MRRLLCWPNGRAAARMAADTRVTSKGTASIALVEQQAVDEAVRTSVFLTRTISDNEAGQSIGRGGRQGRSVGNPRRQRKITP